MKSKKFDWDSIDHVKNRNFSRIRKPVSGGWILFGWMVLAVFLIVLMNVPDVFTVNQATVVGVAGSTVISIFVLLITLNREQRDNFFEAQKSAHILSEIMESVYFQIERVNDGSITPIIYPTNWLDYYEHCAIYLEYDYLEYLLREFEIAEKINSCILANDLPQIKSLIEYRHRSITDWGRDFDIITVKYNLECFAHDWKEQQPWYLEKRYKEFKDYFIHNYSATVKELTIECLKQHNGACGVEVAEYYIMEKLRKDEGFAKGKFEFEIIENKKMLTLIHSAIFKENNKGYSLCWGELTLTPPSKEE